jgi:hypothetical protein
MINYSAVLGIFSALFFAVPAVRNEKFHTLLEGLVRLVERD